MPALDLAQARETATLCNQLIADPKVLQQIEQAKAMSAGNPMMLMVSLMPIAVAALGPTLQKFGFPADQTGILQFFGALKEHENDPELKALADTMREKMMSPELVMLLQMMQAQLPPTATAPAKGSASAGSGAGGAATPALD